jgi:hypothetical protein
VMVLGTAVNFWAAVCEPEKLLVHDESLEVSVPRLSTAVANQTIPTLHAAVLTT